MATYGSFPGVKVTTQSGGITSIAIGAEEKLVLFGESNYEFESGDLVVKEDDTSLTTNFNEPVQINARREADAKFGSDSELADGMREALANGANIDFLYGVAVERNVVESESQSSVTGTLDNTSIVENTGTAAVAGSNKNDFGIEAVEDPSNAAVDLTVELRYDGSPTQPADDSEEVYVNPLTGEYAADNNTVTPIEFDYTYNDYSSAFGASDVQNVVNENETGVYVALSDSDAISSSLQSEIDSLRDDYQMVKGITVAEPNDNETLSSSETTNENGGADARYDASTYSSANQSVSAEYFYKFAPGREEDVDKTIAAGVGGLFAGNPITNPIYNDELSGYQSLEQSFSKTEAGNMRDEDIIPIRSGGSIRVVGNRATNFSTSSTVAADFWTRRITDRVILIGKQIGDEIIGRINDQDTRDAAERRINAEMRGLVQDRLIRSNADDNNWSVDVYEDSSNSNEVNIDISFTPYGIVKRVDETITVNTN
jgi:hypothetical protein